MKPGNRWLPSLRKGRPAREPPSPAPLQPTLAPAYVAAHVSGQTPQLGLMPEGNGPGRALAQAEITGAQPPLASFQPQVRGAQPKFMPVLLKSFRQLTAFVLLEQHAEEGYRAFRVTQIHSKSCFRDQDSPTHAPPVLHHSSPCPRARNPQAHTASSSVTEQEQFPARQPCPSCSEDQRKATRPALRSRGAFHGGCRGPGTVLEVQVDVV